MNKREEAKNKLYDLITRHGLNVIAIGNGTACRETERLVSDLIAEFESRRTGKPIPTETPAPDDQQPGLDFPGGLSGAPA